MREHENTKNNLSYESDGKMGNQNKEKNNNKQKPVEFFNTTQDSE
ncbi:hypothetical protein [Neobacillus ginsengisoli]|uniref:Uncharacterized protein n=1 Tax=Neobacillus ginsengisoli TaxID=904295 RepID=A0ABT9XRI6_9BACI|nr:hypothetical protein [Neobacillus ginsengisoli]MDQ0198013.1 hypothetical protein [Neobacillus ginsengisoli]